MRMARIKTFGTQFDHAVAIVEEVDEFVTG